jgi:uncharacterized membrane protein YqiK
MATDSIYQRYIQTENARAKARIDRWLEEQKRRLEQAEYHAELERIVGASWPDPKADVES